MSWYLNYFRLFYSGKGMASGVRQNGGGYGQQQKTHIQRETDNPAVDRTNLLVTIVNRRLNELRVIQARHDRVIRKRRVEQFKVKQQWFLENTLSLVKKRCLPEVFLPPCQMLGDERMRSCCFSDDGNWLYMLFEKRVKSLGYKFEGDGWQFVDDICFSVDEGEMERVDPVDPRAIYLSIVDANNACDQHVAQPGRDDAAVIMNKAVKCGYLSVVGKLIKGRTSPNPVNAENQTPLQLAVEANHLCVVEYLLRHGAEVNREEPGFYQATPVHRAVLNGNSSMLARLIHYGANCESLTGLGESPLYLAVNRRRLDLVSLLLKQNVNCNQYSDRGFGEFPPFSVDYGATALHLAVHHGDYDIARQLLEHGADVNAKTRGHRETSLIKGVWRQTHGDPVKMILLLLEYPVSAPNPLFLTRHPDNHITQDMTPCLMLVNHLFEQRQRMKIADILDARFCDTANPPFVGPNSLRAIAGQGVWKRLWENKGSQCLFWMYSENEKEVSGLLRLPLVMVRYLCFGQAQADLEG